MRTYSLTKSFSFHSHLLALTAYIDVATTADSNWQKLGYERFLVVILGFEYCVESTIGGFGPVEKTYHLSRRRRWIRQRTMTADAKAVKAKVTKLVSQSYYQFCFHF